MIEKASPPSENPSFRAHYTGLILGSVQRGAEEEIILQRAQGHRLRTRRAERKARRLGVVVGLGVEALTGLPELALDARPAPTLAEMLEPMLVGSHEFARGQTAQDVPEPLNESEKEPKPRNRLRARRTERKARRLAAVAGPAVETHAGPPELAVEALPPPTLAEPLERLALGVPEPAPETRSELAAEPVPEPAPEPPNESKKTSKKEPKPKRERRTKPRRERRSIDVHSTTASAIRDATRIAWLATLAFLIVGIPVFGVRSWWTGIADLVLIVLTATWFVLDSTTTS